MLSDLYQRGYRYFFPPNLDRYVVLEFDKENNTIIEYETEIEPATGSMTGSMTRYDNQMSFLTKIPKSISQTIIQTLENSDIKSLTKQSKKIAKGAINVATNVCTYVGVKTFEVVAILYFNYYYSNSLKKIQNRRSSYSTNYIEMDTRPNYIETVNTDNIFSNSSISYSDVDDDEEIPQIYKKKYIR